MQDVVARIGADGELGAVAWREQHLLQVERPMVEFGFRRPWHLQWRDAAAWVAEAPERRWLWLPADALGPCVDRGQARMIGHASRLDWWLVPGSAIDPQCQVPPFAGDGN